MKKLLLTTVPLFGTVLGEYEGEKLPSNGEPYKLADCMIVIVSPDGRVGMASFKEAFAVADSTIEVNTPYMIVEDSSPLMSVYLSSAKNIILPDVKKIK